MRCDLMLHDHLLFDHSVQFCKLWEGGVKSIFECMTVVKFFGVVVVDVRNVMSLRLEELLMSAFFLSETKGHLKTVFKNISISLLNSAREKPVGGAAHFLAKRKNLLASKIALSL